MEDDYFSAPTFTDLRKVEESFRGEKKKNYRRKDERLSLNVPAQITTQRGNTVSALTRDISKKGIGLLHRGSLTPNQEVLIRMASETREYQYRLLIIWCQPCTNGMCISGGKFIPQNAEYADLG